MSTYIRKRGLSLVEIIIAMTIMIMLIVPIYNLLSVSQRGVHQSAGRLQSKIYSSDLMDLLVSLTFDDLPPYSSSTSWNGDSEKLYKLLNTKLGPKIFGALTVKDIFDVDKEYNRKISIESYNYQDDPVQINFFYKIIRVSTTYKNKKGKSTNFTLTNMVKK
ncbi:prepilin-type N-terminal cleavage/methylation domain-containing protein [bacterium]|nr:prepilin-type N-terminal cleavage/methylation domain-containing protein [bacterium]